MPATRPPPPTATSSVSSCGHCSSNSSPQLPAPATVSGWSKGWAAIADGSGAGVGLDLTAGVRHGHPAEQLLDAASDADLTVVGTRWGTGGMRQAVGSVSYQVSTHVSCPVAVIPQLRRRTLRVPLHGADRAP